MTAPTIRLWTVDLDAIGDPENVLTDTGSTDTGSTDTGSADTGSADTGSADPGPARRRRQARHRALKQVAAKAGVEVAEAHPDCRGNGHSQPTVREPDLAMSVTWAGRWGVVAFADCRVGIDAELLRGAVRPVSSALSPSEARVLESLSGRARSEGFLRLWTAKEAVAKADGRGLALPLPQLDAAPIIGHGQATVVVDGTSWHVAVLDHQFPDGEPVAFAVAADCETPSVIWVDGQ
jgi:4'-phosphopantetheinyl transferase